MFLLTHNVHFSIAIYSVKWWRFTWHLTSISARWCKIYWCQNYLNVWWVVELVKNLNLDRFFFELRGGEGYLHRQKCLRDQREMPEGDLVGDIYRIHVHPCTTLPNIIYHLPYHNDTRVALHYLSLCSSGHVPLSFVMHLRILKVSKKRRKFFMKNVQKFAI